MSDDQRDAEFEASLANLDPRADAADRPSDAEDADHADGGDGGEPDAGAADGGGAGGLASRLDSVHGTLSTLGMRIDALVTSTTSYRSALTDRLAEYAEVVSRTGRNQAADLEEFRKTAQQTLDEVRSSMTASESAVTRIGARLDDLAATSPEESADSRRIVTEVRSLLEAQERLSDFVTESLDRFGSRLVDRVDGVHTALTGQISDAIQSAGEVESPLAGDFAALRADLGTLRSELGVVGTRVDDVAADEEVLTAIESAVERLSSELGSLRADVRATLHDVLAESGIGTDNAAIHRLLGETQETLLDVASGEVVGALWDEVRTVRTVVEQAVADDGTVTRLDAVQAALGDLAAEVRGLAEVAAAPAPSLEEPTDTVTPRLDALQGSIATLADEVAAVAGSAHEAWAAAPATAARIDSLDASIRAMPLTDRFDAVDAALSALAKDLRFDRLDASLQALSVDVSTLARANARTEAVDVPEADPALGALQAQVEAVGAELAAFRAQLTTGLVVEPATSLVADMAALRAAVDELHDRLDDAVVEPDPDSDSGEDTDGPVAEVVDQVAALRDLVRTGLEDLQAQVAAVRTGADAAAEPVELTVDITPFEDAVTELRDEIRAMVDATPAAAATGDPASGGSGAGATGLSDDAVATLREEIQAAGGVADEVMDEVVKELRALRRRLAVKADEKVLDDAQLAQIADAVAARLAATPSRKD